MQLKETLKPWVSVNTEKNFSSDSSRCQTLILDVNTGRKMYHWKVILAYVLKIGVRILKLWSV